MRSWIYLDVDDLLSIAEEVIGQPPVVRDWGLLSSSVVRPAGGFGGQEAYPGLWHKAAALLHSLCMNHALIDGNKRLAWGAARVFLRLNGPLPRGPVDTDAAEALVMSVAKGELTEVEDIADRLYELLGKNRTVR